MDLKDLEKEASTCNLCGLCDGRIKSVFGRGYRNADIIICGMCPGPDENNIGSPFVGRAGKILDEILYTVFTGETEPSDYVYITNLVKCFVQPGIALNQSWMDKCLPYFLVQLSLIKPKVVIGLGGDVCSYLLNADVGIGKLRGNIYDYMGDIKFMCTYHPAYLARSGGSKHPAFTKVVADFEKAVNLI